MRLTRSASRPRTGHLLAVGLTMALVAGGCGDDDGGGAAAGDETVTTAAVSDAPTTEEAGPATTETVNGSGASAAGASRFTGTDVFCTTAEGEPEEAPMDIDDGITADSISIAHARLMVEDLVDLGFAIDLGPQNDFAQAFVDVLNEECGGVYGRKIVLHQVEVPVAGFAPDADALYQQACIEIAEEQSAVYTFTNSGVGDPLAGCLTGPNDTMFITTYDASEREFEQSDGMLFTTTHSPTHILTYAVRELTDELEGKTIGVVYADSGPNDELVQEGLLQALSDAGLEPARVDVIPCPDGPPCTEGVVSSVQGMLADGVDAMFALFSTIDMPGYLAEMVTQGAQPGDVQFYATSFLAQDSELSTGKIIEFAGEDAGRLWNGAVIIGSNLEGNHRNADFEPSAFNQMCNELYDEYSPDNLGPFDPMASDEEARFYENVGAHCAYIRNFARALEVAGPNPTRQEIAAAFATLGEVDLASGTPASFVEGKPTAPDAITRNIFEYPCSFPVENTVGNCVQGQGGYIPIPEG